MTFNDFESNEMQTVIQEFLEESRKYADMLNKDLLTIEEVLKEGQPIPEELLHSIFRSAHTIKGTSSFLGFNNIFKLMHSMETILDGIRKGERVFESEIIDIVFESFDCLDRMLEQLENEGNDEGDIDALLDKLKVIIGEKIKVKQKKEAVKKAAPPPKNLVKKKKAAAKKAKRQIVNETLGDDFLFTNAIIKTFDALDEGDILKQRNNKNNVFEIFIERDKIDDAIKIINDFGDILRYYIIDEKSGIAQKIENETKIAAKSKGIYIIVSSKSDISDLELHKEFESREVYHYKESVLNSMPAKEKERFLKEFIDSTEQQMEEFSSVIMKLEEDPTNQELINAAFRSIHTVKGSAGFISLTSFAETAHKMENIMSQLRERKLSITEEIITLLLEGVDSLSIAMSTFKNDQQAPLNLIGMQEKLDDFLLNKPEPQKEEAVKEVREDEGESKLELSSLTKAETDELKEYLSKMDNLYEIKYLIMKKTPLKSMKASLIETKLEKEGIIIKSSPTIEEIIDDEKEQPIQLIYLTNNDKKFVFNQINIDMITDITLANMDTSELVPKPKQVTQKEEVIEKPSQASPKAPAAQAFKPAQPNSAKAPVASSKPIATTTVRVDIDKLDNLMNLAGELVITKARFSQLVNNMKDLLDINNTYSAYVDSISKSLNEISKDIKGIFSQKEKSFGKEHSRLNKGFNSVREGIEKLDIKASTKDYFNKLLELDENTLKLGKISSDLQNGIMQTRMVPVENVFSRFKRVVRDLSKNLKKDIRLEIRGEDTELYKKIIDELADPLTHMIRNSVDHGIESKEARESSGKPATGTISLSAYHKGNHICVEVGDDGKGLDAASIGQSALKRGIISQQALDGLSEKEILDLIFLPGFSLAREITGVSGRGVGMDVVRKMIESINGSIDILTELGKGTRFILNIPLTLAIIQALLVVLSDDVYAIPLESVIEIIKVKREDIYHIDGGDTIKLRGHALSIIDLRDTIKLRRRATKSNEFKTIVVVTNGKDQLGIVLDSLIGEQEIVIKSLSEHFSGIKGIVGASVLGDGAIALILDVSTIIKLAD